MKTIKRIAIMMFLLLIGFTVVGCKEEYQDLTIREASGSNGVVSSASPYASQAGLEILEQGGNAFEAAVAVAFALGVVEPFASGVGGGGLMVAYNATNGEYISYNFREFVSGNGTAENYRNQYVENWELYAKENNITVENIGEEEYEARYRAYLDKQSDGDEIFKDGALSVGVPTEVSGLITILDELSSGNVTREQVLAPAIRYANEGFQVTANLANTFLECVDYITGIEGADVFFKTSEDGTVSTLEEGDLLVQKDYGKVLEKIAKEGKEGFYQGEVAEAIISAMEEYGGLITQEDLDYAMNNYPTKITPVTGEYKGYTIASSNVPSSGGTILVETLNLLSYYQELTGKDLSTFEHNSAEYINILATALNLAYSDKREYIADTSNDLNIHNYIPTLTSEAYAKWRWDTTYTKELLAGKTGYSVSTGYAYNHLNTGDSYYGDMELYKAYCLEKNISVESLDYPVTDGIEPEEHYSTTSFSVVDKWGNIVSVTQTINHFFGSHIVPTTHNSDGTSYGCGFFLNNQLGTCSFTGSSVNYVKPYKQPVSHIMPTIITKDGLPYATLGSPGSMRIPSTVVQVVLNLIDFDMGIQEAIAAPRIFCYSTKGGDDKSTKWLNSPLGSAKYGKNGKYLWIECASKSLIAELTAKGYYIPLGNRYENIDLYFGGVHGITFDTKTGIMTGGADPRRDGKALAF